MGKETTQTDWNGPGRDPQFMPSPAPDVSAEEYGQPEAQKASAGKRQKARKMVGKKVGGD